MGLEMEGREIYQKFMQLRCGLLWGIKGYLEGAPILLMFKALVILRLLVR